MSSEAIGRRGVPLVLSAPSGAGKTTLAHRLVDRRGDCVFSVSYTTRAPRGGERDGVDYHFVDDAAFERMIEEDDFAEWAEVHGHRYGTGRAAVEGRLDEGRVVIFDIDVQGGEQIAARWRDAATVLIVPPSMAELERRLRSRGTDADEVIRRRLDVARDEIRRGLESYRYVVVNDDLDRAYVDLEAIVRAERCRTPRVGLSGLRLTEPA